jgi:hypothetical protein
MGLRIRAASTKRRPRRQCGWFNKGLGVGGSGLTGHRGGSRSAVRPDARRRPEYPGVRGGVTTGRDAGKKIRDMW